MNWEKNHHKAVCHLMFFLGVSRLKACLCFNFDKGIFKKHTKVLVYLMCKIPNGKMDPFRMIAQVWEYILNDEEEARMEEQSPLENNQQPIQS